MIFGLTLTEEVTTIELGSIAGTMIRWKEVGFCGQNALGEDVYDVVLSFYENRTKYLAKEAPIQVRGENKRVKINVDYGTELTDSVIHLHIKTPLAQVYTLANENS